MSGFYLSSFRQLRRSPAFVFTAAVTLAAGIGVTTAMYSVLYAVMLRPLPFPHPEQLVGVSATPWRAFSIPTMLDWKRRTQAFQSMAAYSGWSPRIRSSAGTGGANVSLVTENLIATLGASLVLGRDFTPSGDEIICTHEAIVTLPYWKRMGGGESLAGRTLQLDHATYAVIGVLAPMSIGSEWDGPAVLAPAACGDSKIGRGDSSFQGIARLKSGVTAGEAGVQLRMAQVRISHEEPRYYPAGFAPVVGSYTDMLVGTSTQSALIAVFAACGTLLLIACANLTNLLLARNTRRRAEFAIRSTLGATPRHLLVQLLTENGILAIAGAGFGMLLAKVLIQIARHESAVQLPRLQEANIDLHTFAFTVAVTIAVALLITLLPGLRSRRPALVTDLGGGPGRLSGTKGTYRVGRLLVASQIAFAIVLVAGAGWMVSSVYILLHQPLGFEPDHILFVSTDLRGPTPDATPNQARTLAVLQRSMDRLRAIPGVSEVAAANDKPLGGRVNRYGFCSDLHSESCDRPAVQAPDNFQVTPGYFHTIGQQIYRGRDFHAADDGRNHVVIVNRALAEQEWPGQDPVGHGVYSGQLKAWAIVVGEVADVHSYSLERAPVPNLYLPEADGPDVRMTLMLRTAADPVLLEDTVRNALRGEAGLSVRYVQTMPEMMEHQVALRRLTMRIGVLFGLLALGMAVFGTYGLLAYEVSMREREVGIRLALGSTRAGIVRLFLQQESRWIAAGVVVGLAGACTTGLLLRAQFFHTRAASAPVLLAICVLLGIPALLAVVIPSRRASLLEPSVILRRD